MGNVQPFETQKAAANGLTPIHARIHCAATQDAPGETDELDRIDIESFLNTLAEVAFAVARREQRADHDSGSLHTGE